MTSIFVSKNVNNFVILFLEIIFTSILLSNNWGGSVSLKQNYKDARNLSHNWAGQRQDKTYE